MSRGGNRPGSGRKKREATTTVAFRIPETIKAEFVKQVKELIEKMKK